MAGSILIISHGFDKGNDYHLQPKIVSIILRGNYKEN